jgi:ATP phosphoribosyltransferase regulatory subunit
MHNGDLAVGAEKIRLDFSVGNNMGYYSGVVFKGYLEGVHTSILSGGQYDKLLRKMGRTSKAIGFALYLDLLERQGRSEINFDVDTVILHDGSADPEALIDAAEEAAKPKEPTEAELLKEIRDLLKAQQN